MLKWTAVNTYIWPPSSQSPDILSSISTIFLTQALRKTVLWLLWYSLDRCAIKSPWYPLHVEQQKSIYRLHAGIGGGGAVLWCLQTIHLFTVSLVSLCWIHFSHSNGSIQYRKVQRETCAAFSPHSEEGDTQWSLENYLGFGGGGGGEGGGQCLYCLISIGSQCRISPSVLVTNCLLWQNSTLGSINCSDL